MVPPGRAVASVAGSAAVELSQLFTTHHYLLTHQGNELQKEYSSVGIWMGLFVGLCPTSTSAGGPGSITGEPCIGYHHCKSSHGEKSQR